MTKAHLSQTSIAVAVEKPEPVGLSVSASRQGGELTLTLVNPKPDAGMTVNCSLEGHPREAPRRGFCTTRTSTPPTPSHARPHHSARSQGRGGSGGGWSSMCRRFRW